MPQACMNRANHLPNRISTEQCTTRGGEFGLFCLAVLAIFIWLFPADFSLAAEQGTASSIKAGQDLCADDSPLWHYFLWQELHLDSNIDPTERSIQLAYQKRQWKPFFFTSGFSFTEEAKAFIKRLHSLEEDGLDPSPYHLKELKGRIDTVRQLRPHIKCSNPHAAEWLKPVRTGLNAQSNGSSKNLDGHTDKSLPAEFQSPGFKPAAELPLEIHKIFKAASQIDIQLINSLIRYSKEMDPFSGQDLAGALSGDISIGAFLNRLEPATQDYTAIRKALAKYRHLAAEHPFKALYLPKLEIGTKGYSVKRLQERLAEEGFYDGKIQGVFDKSTRQAVQSFQYSYQLAPDGVVGAQTIERLNEPYAEKLKMIDCSLKTLRKSQTRRYDRFVRINIPQFVLQYNTNGKLKNSYRVIVGKATGKKVKFGGEIVGINQTPTLVSAIQQVILNPRWYVPDRIRLELNDNLKADPNYLAKNGYVAMSKSYPWGAPRLFQRPGPKNPLGRVKFEFPNRYGVYLHDTPNKQLFRRTRRDFSHGCIRLDNALDFASVLLTDDQNPASTRVGGYLENNRQVFVKLRRPVPIIIEYVPVAADEKGRLVFCGDPYGLLDTDAKDQS